MHEFFSNYDSQSRNWLMSGWRFKAIILFYSNNFFLWNSVQSVFVTAPLLEKSRVGKFLNFFHVIRFSNEGCTGAGGLNGTCYTPEECRDRSGAATSSCAGSKVTPGVSVNTETFRRLRGLLHLWSVLWGNVLWELDIPHHWDYSGTGKCRTDRSLFILLLPSCSASTPSVEPIPTWSCCDLTSMNSTSPNPSPAGRPPPPWPARRLTARG